MSCASGVDDPTTAEHDRGRRECGVQPDHLAVSVSVSRGGDFEAGGSGEYVSDFGDFGGEFDYEESDVRLRKFRLQIGEVKSVVC
jgi:hypothetical protein